MLYLYYLTFAGAHEESNQELDPPSSDLFLFPDESGNLHQDLSPTYPMLHSPLITPVPTLTQETDDFCILETPGSRGDVRIYIYGHKLWSTKTFDKPMLPHWVMCVSGLWSRASSEAAHLRACGNQTWSLQSTYGWKSIQPWSSEFPYPRGALPHQGDLCGVAPLWRERLWQYDFHSLSC